MFGGAVLLLGQCWGSLKWVWLRSPSRCSVPLGRCHQLKHQPTQIRDVGCHPGFLIPHRVSPGTLLTAPSIFSVYGRCDDNRTSFLQGQGIKGSCWKVREAGTGATPTGALPSDPLPRDPQTLRSGSGS